MKKNFEVHLSQTLNLTKMIDDIKKKGELAIPDGVGIYALDMLASAIKENNTVVNHVEALSNIQDLVHCFSMQIVMNKRFLLNPEKKCGANPSFRFRDKRTINSEK